ERLLTAQPGLDQRRSVVHLAGRAVETDQPGLRPGADSGVRLDRQSEHALHAASGRHRERARGAEDLSGVAVVAIEIELPVDHAAAGMNAGLGPAEISLAIQSLAAIADDRLVRRSWLDNLPKFALTPARISPRHGPGRSCPGRPSTSGRIVPGVGAWHREPPGALLLYPR